MNVSVGQSLTATVGAGGSSGGSYGFGSNGGSSQLGSINATYGGGGAAGYGNYNGYAGGSGGGGGNATGNGPPGYGGSGNLGGYSPSEGNSGGNASSDNNTYRNGGAGGGLNLVSSIRGTGNVTYAYGGCQGGNCCACAGINGVNHRPANSGGGGHASSGVYNQFYGTNGGSGIVVISYPDSFDDLTSLTGVTYSKTLANGKKIYSITAGTGTVTV
jgi:hypothetical protein